MKRTMIRAFTILILALGFCFALGKQSEAAQAPRLNLKRLDLTKGTTFTLRVYNLAENETATFKSSNTDVVSIKEVATNKRSVVIYGKTIGSTKIKVTIKRTGKKVDTLKCKVKVAPVPVSIKFTENKVYIKEGQQAYLDVIIKPYSATETPVYESSDEDILTVNSFGLVTALSPGKATITATLLSTGKTAKCTIIVVPNDDDD